MRLAVAGFWLLLLAPTASAADPIMPLDQVQRGMQCEGRSVFRGTEIQSFGVEILDVIDPAPGGGPGILFRASGPLVADTGLGPGFSGSPIYCPDSEGTPRNAGAVAAGIDDYGNEVALATPIEAVLGIPVSPAPAARPATAAERSARPWSLPLTVSGVSGFVRRSLWPAARRAGIDLLVAPAGAAQVQTPVDLQPGSAAGASISNGKVGISAIGTVAYRDENRIWAFGHPLDNAGERSLFLEGAFVHQVVGNPHPAGETFGTYKLSSPGTVAGRIGFDGMFAITGTLGSPPPSTIVDVVTRGPGGQVLPPARTLVADESPLNYPAGLPALSLVTPVSVTDSAFAALDSATSRSHGTLCLRIELADTERRMGFCNRYAGDGRGAAGPQLSMGGDAAIAASLLEEYDREHLQIERIRASVRVDHGLRFATIRDAAAPRNVRRGQRVRIRLRVQPPRGEIQPLSFRMTIPRSVKPGTRTLRLTGSPADPGEGSFGGLFSYALGGRASGHEDVLDEAGPPASMRELRRAIATLHRYDGIRGTFRKPRGGEEEDELAELLGFVEVPDASAGRPLFRHPEIRIAGRAKLKFRVR